MGRRLTLHRQLKDILGSSNVYFQSPPGTKMEYPAIRYQVRLPEVRHADNAPYTYDEGYEVTVIDPDPDSGIRKAIALLPKCRFNRFYVADNLNHYVYNLYF